MFSGRRRLWNYSVVPLEVDSCSAAFHIPAGRRQISQEQINLIKRIANENPLWGAPHVHGEMLKLGYDISEATVQRYVPKKHRRSNGQRWKTFLQNHATQIVAVDFFTVPTVSFRILCVLVFLSHHRRKLIHFNVTDHPTSEWTTQQLRNAFYDQDPPRFLLMDNDSIFNEEFVDCVFAFSTPIRTALHSPWQNGFVERVIGSLRRECLDHLIIVNERHLRRFLKNLHPPPQQSAVSLWIRQGVACGSKS